ncbi:hypothetical protein SGFS_005870 [Streptomyces graminofaciens]|uniref:DUF6777 domain-containing protein n=1 Tax=Streptomyces graminofaciens TaxID=68212 RepID=A0ABN5V8S1_9ACTN|nr:hypothetical protein SGFS_005870 [Streptomyces graminofaciens]
MPRIALIAGAAVVAVVLGLVLTRPDGGSGSGGEIFLQAAAKPGPDPFTKSTATDSSTPTETPTATGATTSEPANVTRGVSGAAPGLYGGTRNTAACDVEKQVEFLQADRVKNNAFAAVEGVQPSAVPAYLRSLTPVQLRMDTRVTNHGFSEGKATSYQAVLQSGTAVLVDDRGVPRVRCACGNPLRPPVAQKSDPKRTGDSWPSYRPQNVVVVQQSTVVINVFVLYDPDDDEWFRRDSGDTGKSDRKTPPPANQPSPSASTSFSEAPPSESPSRSPLPCISAPSAGSSASPCPSSSSPTPSSSAPSLPSSPPSEPSTEPETPQSAGSGSSPSLATTQTASLYSTPETLTPSPES